MRVLGIVPARAGSKRVIGKNYRLLGGKLLIQHVLDVACRSKSLSKVVISTDSREILNLKKNYSDYDFIERPKELARDDSSAIDYVIHALNQLKDCGESEFDAVAIIQPTSPFTLPSDVDQTLYQLWSHHSADSAVSVTRIPHDLHPTKFKIIGTDGRLNDAYEAESGRMTESSLPIIYTRNGSVYATRIESILSNRIIGDNCRCHIMPRERSLDINDEYDFDVAEYMITRR